MVLLLFDDFSQNLSEGEFTHRVGLANSWLANAHAALDHAVWAAYGWDDPNPAMTDAS